MTVAAADRAETVADSAEGAREIDFLHRLVSIPSLSGEEQEVARYLVDSMSGLGLSASIDDAGNAVAELGQGSRHLVLLGHMDTVPGGPKTEIRDGCLYGRGSVDAKGSLATFVMAAARLARDPELADLDLRLTLIGAVEEEVSSSKGARFVAGQMRPDACVIGEPSHAGAITLGYKGRLMVDVERRRPTAHSAGPEPTASAELAADWSLVDSWARQQNAEVAGIFGLLQTELQSLQSGREGDEDVCRGTFGFRLPPTWQPADLEARLRELMPDSKLRFRGHERPWVGPRRGPLAAAFSQGIRRRLATRPRMKHKTGTSDMNVVAPIWQCPILAYGPGDSSLDHTPHEHLELEEYLSAIDVLTDAIKTWASLV